MSVVIRYDMGPHGDGWVRGEDHDEEVSRLTAERDEAVRTMTSYYDRIQRLEGISQSAERDAARYQWLRDWSNGRERRKAFMQAMTTEGFDAAIDAEIAADMARAAQNG